MNPSFNQDPTQSKTSPGIDFSWAARRAAGTASAAASSATPLQAARPVPNAMPARPAISAHTAAPARPAIRIRRPDARRLSAAVLFLIVAAAIVMVLIIATIVAHPYAADFRQTHKTNTSAGASSVPASSGATSGTTAGTPAGTSARTAAGAGPAAQPLPDADATPMTEPATAPGPDTAAAPSATPTAGPTARPSPKPTARPTPKPTARPTPKPAASRGVVTDANGVTWYNGFADPRTINAKTVANPQSTTVLVNKYWQLPDKYVPPLARAPHSNGQSLQPAAVTAWNALYEACLADTGVSLYLVSGYRSQATQTASFNDAIAEKGVAHAVAYYAYPRRSEHQLGLGLDIGTSTKPIISQHFLTTPGGKWMLANGHRFGFILRYPSGRSDLTGYGFEAWHFRYVGVEAATAIQQMKIVLEQY